MKRRTQTELTPRRLVDAALHAPIEWPWKTTRLQLFSLDEYRQRPAAADRSIAELYHENSKLFPQIVPELAIARLPTDFRRQVVLQERAAAHAAAATEFSTDQRWRGLLAGLARTADPDLFYAIELRLVADAVVVLPDPLAGTLRPVKYLSMAELARLRQAVRLLAPPGEDAGALLFVLGRFARNELLLGQRGYRRTLIEAGQVAQQIATQAAEAGLAARPILEFTDRDVDDILEADGVEEGTLVAFELGETTNVG